MDRYHGFDLLHGRITLTFTLIQKMSPSAVVIRCLWQMCSDTLLQATLNHFLVKIHCFQHVFKKVKVILGIEGEFSEGENYASHSFKWLMSRSFVFYLWSITHLSLGSGRRLLTASDNDGDQSKLCFGELGTREKCMTPLSGCAFQRFLEDTCALT